MRSLFPSIRCVGGVRVWCMCDVCGVCGAGRIQEFFKGGAGMFKLTGKKQPGGGLKPLTPLDPPLWCMRGEWVWCDTCMRMFVCVHVCVGRYNIVKQGTR